MTMSRNKRFPDLPVSRLTLFSLTIHLFISNVLTAEKDGHVITDASTKPNQGMTKFSSDTSAKFLISQENYSITPTTRALHASLVATTPSLSPPNIRSTRGGDTSRSLLDFRQSPTTVENTKQDLTSADKIVNFDKSKLIENVNKFRKEANRNPKIEQNTEHTEAQQSVLSAVDHASFDTQRLDRETNNRRNPKSLTSKINSGQSQDAKEGRIIDNGISHELNMKEASSQKKVVKENVSDKIARMFDLNSDRDGPGNQMNEAAVDFISSDKFHDRAKPARRLRRQTDRKPSDRIDPGLKYMGLGKRSYGESFSDHDKRGRLNAMRLTKNVIGLSHPQLFYAYNRDRGHDARSGLRSEIYNEREVRRQRRDETYNTQIRKREVKRDLENVRTDEKELDKRGSAGLKYIGMGKRTPSSELKFIVLGKKDEEKRGSDLKFVGLGTREDDKTIQTNGLNFVGLDERDDEKRGSSGLRFVGLGKRNEKIRASSGMKFMGLGKREEDKRAPSSGLKFVGLGKREDDERAQTSGLKFVGLGKRDDEKRGTSGLKFVGLGKREEDKRVSNSGLKFVGLGKRVNEKGAPATDLKFEELGDMEEDKRASSGLKFVGLGKRDEEKRGTSGMTYLGLGKKASSTGLQFMGLGKREEEKRAHTSALKFVGLGKRDGEKRGSSGLKFVGLGRRAQPAGLKFVGLGRRAPSSGLKFMGLGKRDEEKRSGFKYVGLGKRTASSGLKFVGLGKRDDDMRSSAGLKYVGLGKRPSSGLEFVGLGR